MTKGISMAQDYDSPRNKDEDEESLQALSKGSQNNSNDMDDDENAIAEDYELPGADLSNEDASVTVIPMQGDEFICSECFLVKHRSQLAYTTDDGQPVCKARLRGRIADLRPRAAADHSRPADK